MPLHNRRCFVELWLDTANPGAVKSTKRFGILYGLTTNPTVFAAGSRELCRVPGLRRPVYLLKTG